MVFPPLAELSSQSGNPISLLPDCHVSGTVGLWRCYHGLWIMIITDKKKSEYERYNYMYTSNKHGESWFRCHRHQNHDSNFSLAGPTWGTITLIPEPWSIRGSAECNKSKDEQTATEKTIGCTAATSLAGVLFFHGNLSPWSFFSSRFGNTTLDYVVKSAIMSLCRLEVFFGLGVPRWLFIPFGIPKNKWW